MDTYKVREKTKLEIVYEFLGISSTNSWDSEEDTIMKNRKIEKGFLVDIKRLFAY